MKKILFSFLPIFFAFFLTSPTFASSNLEISTNSDFSNQTLNFSAGQTIYVRLNSESSGAKSHVLNVRDNQYNLLNSYDLTSSGNQFKTNFSAPTGEGYYSLEAKIESEGSQTTSVKTIKVGSPQNANVNVNIHNSTTGEKVLGTDSTKESPEPVAQKTDNDNAAYQSSSGSTNNIDESSDITFEAKQPVQKKSFSYKVKIIFIKIVSIIWPF